MRRFQTQLQKTLKQFAYLPRALVLVRQAASRWTVGWLILLIAQGLLPVALAYLTRALVNQLTGGLRQGELGQELPAVLAIVAAMAACMLALQGLRSLGNWIRTAQSELVQDHISTLIHLKASALDISFYDNPAYYDILHRARVDAINRPVALLENLGSLFQNSLTLIAMAWVLLPLGVWIPAALVISTLPALYVAVHHTLRQHEWRLRTTSDQRRVRYYDWMLTLRDAAAELRLFNLSGHFQESYRRLRDKLRTEQLHLARDEAIGDLLAASFALSILGLAAGWMVWQAMQGLVSLGDLALFYQAFSQGQGLMQTLLGNVGQVYSNSLFLENLFDFLALQPQIHDSPGAVSPPLTLVDGLRFEQVTFSYPDSDRTTLDGFDLFIPAGQVTAIVGSNGAGKTTLLKLICRFYDPASGRILLDGTNLKDMTLAGLRRIITVLFQEPVHYHDTAARNIAFSDLASAPNRQRIETAAEAAGAAVPITRLPRGYETALGKWFGGAELSVGEWQRVALARAFLRQSPIIILDEPTSAMDSWAEADWMARFRTLVAGRTTLMITHRFTTAMQADVIHVMEAGRIVESGSHAALIARAGPYATSWRTQTQAAREQHADSRI